MSRNIVSGSTRGVCLCGAQWHAQRHLYVLTASHTQNNIICNILSLKSVTSTSKTKHDRLQIKLGSGQFLCQVIWLQKIVKLMTSNDLYPTTMNTESFCDPLDNLTVTFTGFFNGFNVELRTPEDMKLHKMGCYGKGSASRSSPKAPSESKIMRRRQFQKRIEWYKKFSGARVQSKPDLFLQAVDKLTAKVINEGEKWKNKDLVDLVSSEGSSSDGEDGDDWKAMNDISKISDTDNIAVVVPDSDSDDNTNYFENMKAECCVDQTKSQEKLMLTLPEAFFLVYGLGSLQIINMENHILNIEQTWDLFKETDKKFIPKYVVYHYFRSKGYIVKPGIKFGGDYLLYRCSPELAHSDYIVVIKFDNDETNWVSILGHVRMANTTVKEILIAEVVSPDVPGAMPEGLKNYSVRSTVLTRNIGTINEDVE